MGTERRMKNFHRTAFTLIEVMVSIVLLGLIFTFVYSAINSMKQQNNHYISKSNEVEIQEKIFSLLNLDITQVIGGISISSGDRFDIIQFKTKNSIYQIVEPNVTYFVSKKDKALVRIESINGFNLFSKDDFIREFMFGDILTTECISFKVSYKEGLLNLLLRGKSIKPMILKIPTVS